MKKAFLILVFIILFALIFIGVRFISTADTSIYIEAWGYTVTISSFAIILLFISLAMILKIFFIIIDWIKNLFLIGELGYSKILLKKYGKILMEINDGFMEKNPKYSSYDYHVYLINIINSKSLDEKIKYARMLVDRNLNKDTNFFGYKTLAVAELELNMFDVALSSANKALSIRKNDERLKEIVEAINTKE
jgi:hypothetical protein